MVFIAPPSVADLAERLRGGRPTAPRRSRVRLEIAATELAAADEFDLVVVNDVAERAAAEVAAFITERHEGDLMDKPRIDELLPMADNSRYALAIIAAKRARQINNYYNSLGEGTFDEFPPPLVTTRSKNLLTIAFEEIVEGKISHQARAEAAAWPLPTPETRRRPRRAASSSACRAASRSTRRSSWSAP